MPAIWYFARVQEAFLSIWRFYRENSLLLLSKTGLNEAFLRCYIKISIGNSLLLSGCWFTGDHKGLNGALRTADFNDLRCYISSIMIS